MTSFVRMSIALAFLSCSPAPTEPPTIANGEACELDEECLDPEAVCHPGYEDGRYPTVPACVRACDRVEVLCRPGFFCAEYGPTDEFYCFPRCSDIRDCIDTWRCATLSAFGGGFCVPALEP